MSPQFCDACSGKRLKPEILAVTLGGEGFTSQFKIQKIQNSKFPACPSWTSARLSVEKADEFFAALKLTEFEQKIAREVIKEIRARLGFLKNVGLGYLTLNRESGTLSGGEAQRIRLATQIGAALVGVLYILDEPSIGLHQRDNDRLLAHAERPARSGQFGARRGTRCGHDSRGGLHPGSRSGRGRPRRRTGGGGHVAGNSRRHNNRSPAKYLTGELTIPVPKKRIKPSEERGWLEVLGARKTICRTLTCGFRSARSPA